MKIDQYILDFSLKNDPLHVHDSSLENDTLLDFLAENDSLPDFSFQICWNLDEAEWWNCVEIVDDLRVGLNDRVDRLLVAQGAGVVLFL